MGGDKQGAARGHGTARWQLWWVIGLFVLSAALLTWHQFGMNRVLTITADSGHSIRTRNDGEHGGTSRSQLVRTAHGVAMRCRMTTDYRWPYCGISVRLGRGGNGVDLSHFQTVELDLETRGAKDFPLSVYLLNYNRRYSRVGDMDTLKVNTVHYVPNTSPRPLRLPLGVFHVAQWWLTGQDVPLAESATDLTDVVALEMYTGDVSKAGYYGIVLHRVTFRGKWLGNTQVLSIILALWLASALAYFVLRFVQYRRRALQATALHRQLESVNRAVQLERWQWKQRAVHDELTGLYNRAGLRDRLYQAVLASRTGAAVSVVLLDIDHFKRVNDEHGHLTGDAVLRELADLLRRHSRDGDCACRWGGEEFVLLYVGVDQARASVLAENFRRRVQAHGWPAGLALTCSFGVAQIRPVEDARDFLQRADQALYRAKNAGRNRVYPPPGDG